MGIDFELYTADNSQEDTSELVSEMKRHGCDTAVQYDSEKKESIVYTLGSSGTRAYATMHLEDAPVEDLHERIKELICKTSLPHFVDSACKLDGNILYLNSDEVDISRILLQDN